MDGFARAVLAGVRIENPYGPVARARGSARYGAPDPKTRGGAKPSERRRVWYDRTACGVWRDYKAAAWGIARELSLAGAEDEAALFGGGVADSVA